MRFEIDRRRLLILMLPGILAVSAPHAEEPQNPPSAEHVVVMKASGHDKVTHSTTDLPTAQEPGNELRASTVLARPLKPAPELDDCNPPELTVEILDPATDRAVIREGSNPPQVVKPGSVLASSALVVRQIGVDKLVAYVDVGNGGLRPVLWIFASEKPGEPPRVQCFLAATSPSPPPRSATAEPTSPP